MLDALKNGAFNDAFYTKLASERFGLVDITREEVNILDQLAKDLDTIESTAVRNRHLMKFQDKVKDIQRRAGIIDNEFYENLLEVWYTSILSGFSTTARAGKGASMTSAANAISIAIVNPVATFQGLRGFSAFFQGVNSLNTDGFMQILRDGYSDIDFSDGRKPIGTRFLDKLINEKVTGNTLSERAIRKSFKAYMFPAVKMVRLLYAMDAIIKSGNKELESYVIEYNKLLRNSPKINKFGLREAKFFSDINKALANNESFVKGLKQKVQEEKADLVSRGLLNTKQIRNFESSRLQELKEENRDSETVKTAHRLALKSVLMNDPEGVMGQIFRGTIEHANIKPSDSKFTKAGKIIAKSIFPFMRVAINLISIGVDYSPLGFARVGKRAFSGKFRKDKQNNKVRTREGSRDFTPEEKQRALASAGIGTVVMMGIMSSVFDWDEDEGFSLNPNSFIELNGPGTGNFVINQAIRKDFKTWSFRIRNPFGDDDSWLPWFSFIDNPLGLVLAPIAIASDQIRFKDFKKTLKNEELEQEIRDIGWLGTAMIGGFSSFAAEQSYSQGLNRIMGMLGLKGQAQGDELAKAVIAPVKGFFPNIYKQMFQQWKAWRNIPIKPANDLVERLLRDIPLVEQLIKGHLVDQFGYPITKRFDPPLVPEFIIVPARDVYERREDTKHWELVYKFPEVTVGMGFRAPKDLDSKEKTEFQNILGLEYRKKVDQNFNRMNKMDARDLQLELNRLKKQARTEGTRKWKNKK